MTGVILKNICKHYGSVKAVARLNLEIQDGEFVVLVGPSGCGKSTTLRMIAGLEEITDGEIWIGESMVNGVPAKDRDIAMVFQNYALYPHMTVHKNLAFGLTLRKFKSDEIDQRINRASQILGLTELLERKPAQLSGGQQQRVALGRAMVREPAVFLFDEPLSNLDAQLRTQMRTELQQLHRQLESTMVFVTHDQIEAMTLGDRIAVLNQGQLQQYGSPRNIYQQPENLFVAQFFGYPSINLLKGEIIREADQHFYVQQDLKLVLPPQWNASVTGLDVNQVVLGIRPEAISLNIAEPSSHTENRITGKLISTQLIGAEIVLMLQSGNQQLVLKSDARREYTPGENLTVCLDLSQAHLFASHDGARLTD